LEEDQSDVKIEDPVVGIRADEYLVPEAEE
jgi:hypothetical protein